MIRCHFDLFSSRGCQVDKVGDDFENMVAARRMSRAILLDYAEHHFTEDEGCVIVCKIRTSAPERYCLTSLAIVDGSHATHRSGQSGSLGTITLGASEEGHVAYRMSSDWTDMRELKSDGFLTPVDAPDRAWFMNYIPSDERPRVAVAIDRAIQLRAPFDLTHRIIRADDTIAWAASWALPVVDERGDISEWIGVARSVAAATP